jgi:protease IV
MKEFFKNVLASLVGQLFAGIILMFLFAVFLVSMFMGSLESLGEEKDTEIKDHSVLHLRFTKPVTDQERNQGFSFGADGFIGEKGSGLNVILESIERAATDDKIKGIFLDLGVITGGIATIEEIRNALIEFKKSGKFIVSYAELFTHKSYYLSSVADEILIYPEGFLQHTGLTAEIMFLKGMIEKMELDLTIIRGTNNKFKSAVEPLILESMSESNRRQTETYLFAIWNHMLKGISETRKKSVEDLNMIADSLFMDDADKAVKYGFADKKAYRDEVLASLKTRAGTEEKDELELVSITKYNKDKRFIKKKKEKDQEKSGKPKIAVIYATGDIIDGKGDDNSIGSITLSEQIRDARTDTSVKAIVLRVNSPGGSALASDVIWRETILAKETKPFIVSMGDVAASGGYYIACAADKIYAQPTTITGSIGVFGVLPNIQRMMKEKLGITYDRVKTNKHSDLGSVTRPMDDFEYLVIQRGVDDIYGDFISKVASGRQHKNLSTADVDSIGQGRVWAGTDALRLGLVDELGGLNDAIAEAAKRANLTDFIKIEYPEVKDPFEELLEKLSGEEKMQVLFENFGINREMMMYLYNIKRLLGQKGVKAFMPFYLEIH